MPKDVTVEVLVTPEIRRQAIVEDVRAGLTSRPRSIPPVWFYDEVGSRLFDEITRLPEYYLTRAERQILEDHAAEVVASAAPEILVEIGSGTSEKTRILLDAMAAAGTLKSITLLDISEEILRDAAETLVDHYDVDVHAVVGDFTTDLPKLPRSRRQLWAFLGSTIGNFDPQSRHHLLSDMQMTMGSDDHLLLGTDLRKDPARLVAAYDDLAGITARFNRNVLDVLNAELHADFRTDRFEHVAVWNDQESRIEMHLRSVVALKVEIADLGLTLDLAAGEEILTEISSKFDRQTFPAEFRSAGLSVVKSWTDPAGDFMLTLAGPAL